MKRNFLSLVALVLFSFGAHAQNGKWNLEVNLGIDHYNNYPAISAFNDGEVEYVAPSVGISAGYELGSRLLLGLDFSVCTMQVPTAMAQNQQAVAMRINPKVRLYQPLSSKVSVFGQFNVGAMALGNMFTFADKDYSGNRWGMFAAFDVGLQCNLSDDTYLAVQAEITPYAGMDKSKMASQVGLPNNSGTVIGGYALKLTYGVKF